MLRRFSIVPFDHRRIDTLDVDAIVLPFFQERIQPQGAAGYFDWRLCGRLGRLIQDSVFDGASNELMLLSYAARVGPCQLFLLGLGPPKLRSATRCIEEIDHVLEFLSASKAKSVALGIPQPHALETLCNWIQAPGLLHSNLHELIVLDADKVFESAREKINPLLKKAGLYKLSGNLDRPVSTASTKKPASKSKKSKSKNKKSQSQK